MIHIHTGSAKLFAAFINGTNSPQAKTVGSIASIPGYLRVTRSETTGLSNTLMMALLGVLVQPLLKHYRFTQVGFTSGNAGANPAFTASADYFMSGDDPITDTDTQITDPPTIEVWYGDNQTFGNIGNPQQWVNI
ncbi:MAG: hypothetical protein U5K00_07455 [Melioribacteraceae bacterium]|nr:hypothetical protein [Melioribacteraceae bacterium]